MTPAQVSLRSGLGWMLLTAVLTALLYLPSLNGTFVYDDALDIVENPAVHDLGDIPDYLSLSAMRRGLYDAVRPVYVASIMAEWAVWGADPFGYHLTNLVLHVLNALLLFLWLRQLFLLRDPGRKAWAAPCAALGALLFSFHPAASEAVCAITFRKDLMVTFFTLLGLNGLAIFSGRGGWRDLAVAVGVFLAFLLAVGSKEAGIVGPYLALLYWILFRREGTERAWAVLLGAVFLGVHAFLLLRFSVPHDADTVAAQYLGGSFGKMFSLQPRIWAYQLWQLLFPGWARLNADPLHLALGTFSFWSGILTTLAALALAVWASSKDRMILFGAAFYVLAILPVSNLLPMPQVMADRFLYLPLAGMAIIAAALLFRFLPGLERMLRVAVLALGLAVFASLGWQTLGRERVWHDDLSLWTETLAMNPNSLMALMGRAGALDVNGDFAGAAVAYAQVNQMTRGGLPDAWSGLAASLEAMGRTKEADQAYAELVKRDPRYLTPTFENKRVLRFSDQDVKDFQRMAKRYEPKG